MLSLQNSVLLKVCLLVGGLSVKLRLMEGKTMRLVCNDVNSATLCF